VLLAQALCGVAARDPGGEVPVYPLLGVLLAAVLGERTPGSAAEAVLLAGPARRRSGRCACLTIASLRERSAGQPGAMCYLLSISLMLFICAQNNVPFLPNIALDITARASSTRSSASRSSYHWWHLAAPAFLACVWPSRDLPFRRYGWQT